MVPLALNTATTTYPEFSNPRFVNPPVYSSASLSHHRVRTYTAHALILFNVYGVPLSSGLWLEHHFTSSYPSLSLLAISSIYGVQLVCFGLAAAFAMLLHCRWPKCWRLHMSLGGLSVCMAHLWLLVSEHIWVMVLCQGALTGLGLGMLGAVSTRVLSSHYKRDMAVASTLCVAAGYFGVIVYSVLTWICLQSDDVKMGYGIMTALLAFTVLPAILLAKPCAPHLHSPYTPDMLHVPHYCLFPLVLLTLLIPAALSVPPLFLPLVLTRHQTPFHADSGCYLLLSLSLGALISSTLFPRLPPHRLSPFTLVSASLLLSGIALLPVLWMPSLSVAIPCAVVFGVGMGGVCVLYVKGVVGLMRGVTGLRGCVLLGFGGVGTGCATVGAAAVLERWDGGAEIVLDVVMACLGVAGMVVGGGARVRSLEARKGVERL